MVLAIFLCMFVGISIVAQNATNAILTRHANLWLILLVGNIIGTLGMVILYAATRGRSNSLAELSQVPLLVLLPAACGVVIMAALPFSIGRIGPWFELCHEHAQRHIDFCFELATRLDRDLHALVDDEPIAPHTRNLEQLALATIARGWEGRVAASHACGLASYDDFSAERLMRLVAQAGITISCNAHVSLVSKCQHARQPVPRGITRVRELVAHGVNVTCAQDDVADPYYPFGRGDMLEVASFLAHTAHLYRPADVDYVLDAITVGAAKGMRLPDYGLREGARADLVVLAEGDTATEALRLQPARRYVLHRGRVVAETRTETTAAGSRSP